MAGRVIRVRAILVTENRTINRCECYVLAHRVDIGISAFTPLFRG